MSNSIKNDRIAKNTFLLYARMLFVMAINLYTSRVVLDALGVVDYGLYNVVGGIVMMFTFISTAMSNSTLRFITYSLGKYGSDRLMLVFNTSVFIHLTIAVLILILAETIGLWLLYNKMVIPEERFFAAQWVYQFSILSCMSSIIVVPYISLIKAHEKMSAFAFISVVDVVLRLFIAFVIQWAGFDQLILYAFLLLCIHIMDIALYGFYCKRHFEESSFSFTIDNPLLKEMTGFAGWSLVGNLAWMGYTQGLNILLNMFFGPAVNAARGVAVQVQNAVKGFVTNFQTAINPQITKSYATGDLYRVRTLIFSGSKISYYLLLLFVVPLILEADTVLSLWLKEVPVHTVNFLRLILMVLLIEPLSNPIGIANNATGDIKRYQIIEGGLLLFIVPFSYILLKNGLSPETVFVVQFVISFFVQFVRILLVQYKLDIRLGDYCKDVLLPILVVTIVSSAPPFILCRVMHNGIFETTIVIVVAFASVAVSAYLVGLNKRERAFVMEKAKSVLHRVKKK